jgi:hypothetical protein
MMLILLASVTTLMEGCKSKAKLAREKAAREYAEKVAQAKAELLAILNDDGTMPLAEKERRYLAIRDMNLNDPEVNDLLAKVAAKIAAEKDALARKQREEEEQKRLAEEARLKEATKFDYLDEYFYNISHSSSTDGANQKIEQALKLFSSEEVPVLIIISESGGITDYDKPTDIKKYLHYLKDQKKYDCKVKNAVTDEYGLITELELIKKQK